MPKFSEIAANDFLKVVQQTAGYLETLLKNLPDQDTNISDSSGNWHPLDILIHLHACQKVWGFTIYAMLAAENTSLVSYHPSQFAALTYQTQPEYSPLLESFLSEKNQLFSLLQILSPGEWATVGFIGKREHSVFSQVRRLALHEQGHWSQIISFFP